MLLQQPHHMFEYLEFGLTWARPDSLPLRARFDWNNHTSKQLQLDKLKEFVLKQGRKMCVCGEAVLLTAPDSRSRLHTLLPCPQHSPLCLRSLL